NITKKIVTNTLQEIRYFTSFPNPSDVTHVNRPSLKVASEPNVTNFAVLKNMASSDSDDDVPTEFEEALYRITAREMMGLTAILADIEELKGQMIKVRADSIYAEKEIQAVHNDANTKEQLLTGKEERTRVTVETDELHSALVNHRIVRDLYQKSVFNTQIQQAVHASVKKIDTDELVENFPEKGQMLAHYSSNLNTSKDIAKIMDENDKLEEEILEQRLKYRQLLKGIKEKWETLDENKSKADADVPSHYDELQKKVQERTSKMNILVHMIQGLISISGFQWGSEDFYVQVMMLCDIALRFGDYSEAQKVLAEVVTLKEEKKKQEARKKKITSYFTSTPAAKKK
ncbi:LOW QUALITY PROTEIN: uncharacterized protein LOC119596236, partial [Penaeus monodon]|uniref:LOW QUALITY PROTEIN: uncharacterized protein LOC119596236 n=1 Tax=Penaeus monodon TaxID=6687 RepID=UPI0018A793E7